MLRDLLTSIALVTMAIISLNIIVYVITEVK
jgi:hypothetical protein